mgnify:FL=1
MDRLSRYLESLPRTESSDGTVSVALSRNDETGYVTWLVWQPEPLSEPASVRVINQQAYWPAEQLALLRSD